MCEQPRLWISRHYWKRAQKLDEYLHSITAKMSLNYQNIFAALDKLKTQDLLTIICCIISQNWMDFVIGMSKTVKISENIVFHNLLTALAMWFRRNKYTRVLYEVLFSVRKQTSHFLSLWWRKNTLNDLREKLHDVLRV